MHNMPLPPPTQVSKTMKLLLALEGCILFIAATAYVAHLTKQASRGPLHLLCNLIWAAGFRRSTKTNGPADVWKVQIKKLHCIDRHSVQKNTHAFPKRADVHAALQPVLSIPGAARRLHEGAGKQAGGDEAKKAAAVPARLGC